MGRIPIDFINVISERTRLLLPQSKSGWAPKLLTFGIGVYRGWGLAGIKGELKMREDWEGESGKFGFETCRDFRVARSLNIGDAEGNR